MWLVLLYCIVLENIIYQNFEILNKFNRFKLGSTGYTGIQSKNDQGDLGLKSSSIITWYDTGLRILNSPNFVWSSVKEG